MKGKVKRILSGMLSVITIMTSIIQPITIYAVETEPAAYEAKYPSLEKVKDNLAEEEVVQVQDYEVEVGSSFDVKTDFSGMKFKLEKVKVTFYEAKNESGQDFDVNQADSYKAVYFVEPFSKNPSYHVTRKIIVKEPITEVQTERSSDSGDNSGQTGESESEEDSEAHSEIQSETEVTESETVQEEKETELDAALEAAEEQDTVDEESGLSLGNVMLQAVEQGVDLLEMEEGETVTFTAQAPAMFSARASQNVTVTRDSWYYYADYGLGTYLTAPYTVTFGNVTATAYCVQSSKPGPDDGNYTITKLADGKTLAKVCYYGTKASGDEGFFAEKHPDFSTGKRFIITHLAASYANGSSDAFSGTNSTGQSLAMELYNYCVNQPEIPDVAMSFSNANVTAYVEGNEQRTEVITFKADTLQTITMKLPAGVKFHNVTTGNTSKASADVEVSGGTKFYLSAPLTQTADVSGSWSATMKGSITKDYSAYKITTGSSTQDLALVFGEGVTDEKYVDFSVKWLELAKVGVVKVDSKNQDAKLSGAVFGIYSDKNCTQLITQMPATDNNGASVVEIVKTQDTVYLKEITAPKGYRINTTAYNVKLVANQTVTTTVPDEEQLGELTVYKEGQVLTGADMTDAGVTFRYENRRQEGAVYDVYAGEDIYTAYGAQVYKKGDLVKGNLTTDSNGAVILKNLHLGTYLVRETQAPKNFYNSGEEKKITLSYAGQNVEVVFSETTFTNDRQKAKVTVQKLDQDTRNPLDGGIFGMYAGSDITAWDGTVIVKKGTLIEKAVKSWDGRFSQVNKEWAKNITIPENVNRGMDANLDYVVESHPAVLDGFIDLARKRIAELEIAPEKEQPFIVQHYVVNDAYGVKAERSYQYFDDIDEAISAYHQLPNHLDKQIGMESTEQPPSRMALISGKNGIEELENIAFNSLSGKWVNPETNKALEKAEFYLESYDREVAYWIANEEKYLFVQTVSDGYDYTIYDKEYRELDGGIYSDPELSFRNALLEILEDELRSYVDACEVIECEEFLETVERAEYFPQRSFEALKGLMNSGEDKIAFKTGYGYASIQKVQDGYNSVVYDSDWREIGGKFYDVMDVSMEEAVGWLFKDEDLGKLECEPIIYDELEKHVLQAAKERLKEDQITPTSQISIREASLNGQCRHDIEEMVLCFAQAQIEQIGLSEEVRLFGARVYGSRTREGMYQETSDVDVVLSYTGNIREDDFFNILHESGMKITGLSVDVNPISTEKTGTLEKFMEDAEKYLDDKELQQLASDIDQFSSEYDLYEYRDSVENRKENVRQIYSDLISGQTDSIREWVAEIAVDENGDLPEVVEEAKKLLARIEQAQKKGRAEIVYEPEKVDAKITFYVAECMEFSVLGEYHDNLTLQEAVALYEKIPSERMNGVKGIGFCLEDGSMYDGEYELMSGDKISKDLIDLVPYYKDHPLVQGAISDLEEILSQKRQMAEKEVVSEISQEQPTKQEKTPEKAPEEDSSTSKGTGIKESVLKALRERQARLKEQNHDKDEQKSKGRKKGEQEL